MNGAPERSGAGAHASPACTQERRAQAGRWGEAHGWSGGVLARTDEPLSGKEVNAAFDAAHRDHEVAVVGMGAYSPLGRDCDEMKQALLDGRDSIEKVTPLRRLPLPRRSGQQFRRRGPGRNRRGRPVMDGPRDAVDHRGVPGSDPPSGRGPRGFRSGQDRRLPGQLPQRARAHRGRRAARPAGRMGSDPPQDHRGNPGVPLHFGHQAHERRPRPRDHGVLGLRQLQLRRGHRRRSDPQG